MSPGKPPCRSSDGEKSFGDYTTFVHVQPHVDELALKLDKHGIPLSPQPSAEPKDSLNCPKWLKWVVLVQISALSFTTYLSASMVSPAFFPLSRYLHRHRGLSDTAYTTSIVLATTGVSPFFWNPLSNVLGRRPIWLLCLLGSAATSAASGAARNYEVLLALRALAGIFTGIPQALGSPTVCDMFFAHERGFYMGLYAVSSIAGAHAAPVLGGFVARAGGWRWTFYGAAVGFGALLLPFVLSVPETLFSRSPAALALAQHRSWRDNLLMRGRPRAGEKRLAAVDFVRAWQMLKYPSVLLPALYLAVSLGFGSIIFILSGPAIFSSLYGFAPYQIGMLVGLSLTLGNLAGEVFAGGFCDWVSESRALQRGGKRRAEDRLLAILPGTILTPAGLILEGFCIQRRTHWSGPALGIAMSSVGFQIVTTVVFTYTAECYKSQAAHTGTIINFFCDMFGFCVAFYDLKMGETLGFQAAWTILAMINVAFFFPVLILFWKGEQ
ncbi:major facilitator superfamily domain-containing protein [Phyllosticta citribraziliensis]|uniref:Major facilitator superfamily domain-containing protein n=1 Tax=Phyllosticta citribraziliensis TaxID=989973 RepID=A0ABR1LTR0_9PEZI